MYKIMLADDEGIELDALSFIIDKNFGGQCEVKRAKMGREAIELAARFSPDIAVMDIRMPGINGIEAIREIQKLLPSVVFIVLTAYERFEYAQEAINLSVFDFLTKPVNRATFAAVLTRAMEKTDADKAARDTALEARERIENMLPVLENSFIYLLLSQNEEPGEYEKLYKLLGMNAPCGTVMVLELQTAGSDALDVDIKLSELYPTVRGLIKDSFESVVGPAMASRVIFVRPCAKPENEYRHRLLLIEQGRQLAHRVQDKTGAPCRLGIGTTVETPLLCQSYSKAIKAVKNCKGVVSHYNDLPIGSQYEGGYPAELEQRLEQAVLSGDVQSATQSAEVFFQWMLDHYPEHDMSIRLKVLEFVMRSEYNVFHKGGMNYHFLDRSDYMQTVLAAEDYQALKNWFLRKLADSARASAAPADQKENGTAAKARRYIDENFRRDLTLEEVSREVFVSPYYFSKLFKEQTGMNYIDYLTKKRMDAAKGLLKGSGMSIKQICNQIGYSDPNYFSRLFRKLEGITPTEYRGDAPEEHK